MDFAATNAIGADAHASCRAVDQSSDGLQIRTKHPFGTIVGMADIVAHGVAFPAHFTDPCH